ncbi:hypothetical protein GC194_12835 [bacterium]|nr:hypothetical protein [bacterium]
MSRLVALLSATALLALLASCHKHVKNPCPNGKLPLADTVFRYDSAYYKSPSRFFIYTKAKVNIVNGDFSSYRVNGPHNLLSRLKTHQTGDSLNLDYSDCIFHYSYFSVTVLAPQIDYLSLHDSSQLAFDANYAQNKLELELNDRVSGKIDGTFESLSINNNSTEAFSIAGAPKNLLINHYGTKDVDARDAKITIADVKNYAKSDLYIPPVETLYVTINDSGNVYYQGDPVIIKKGGGVGSVIKL